MMIDSDRAIGVTINGKPDTLPTGITVAEMLRRHDLDARRVAVEVNERLVLRKSFDQTEIRPDDRIEIVTFVGGG